MPPPFDPRPVDHKHSQSNKIMPKSESFCAFWLGVNGTTTWRRVSAKPKSAEAQKSRVWGLGASPPFKISNKAKPEKHAKEQELFAP